MPTFRFIARLAMALTLAAGFAWAQDNDTVVNSDAPKPATRARRVITNDDIPPSSEAEAAPPKGKQASGKLSGEATHDRAAALSKVGLSKDDDDARQAIEQIRKREIALQEKLHHLKDKLAGEDDDFRRQMWVDALENQKATLDQYRKVRERLEQELHPDQAKPSASSAPTS
jgi:predicted  nucleic acid-binding Zn-ribbon protein